MWMNTMYHCFTSIYLLYKCREWKETSGNFQSHAKGAMHMEQGCLLTLLRTTLPKISKSETFCPKGLASSASRSDWNVSNWSCNKNKHQCLASCASTTGSKHMMPCTISCNHAIFCLNPDELCSMLQAKEHCQSLSKVPALYSPCSEIT